MSDLKDSELNQSYAMFAASPLGQIILNDLERSFDGVCFVPDRETFSGSRATDHRLGSRHVVEYIKGRIARGQITKEK